MKSKVLRDWSEVDAIADDWRKLQTKAEQDISIFQTYDWVSAWQKAVDGCAEPRVVVVTDERNDLVGIAPLYRARFRIARTVNLTVWRYMGDVASGSEYPAWVLDPARAGEIANKIAEELRSCRREWDVIWLAAVAGWDRSATAITESCRNAGLSAKTREEIFSAFELPGSLLEYENSFSSRRRQQMRRQRRRVSEIDGIEFQTCRAEEELPEYLEALFDLHQRRWKSVGKNGCFLRRPAEERFYRNFAPVALRNGQLALYGLRLNGVLKAVQYGYFDRGTYLQLQEGYDPDFIPGAGNALRLYSIGECIRAGITEYDFLAGVSEHKRRWSARERTGHDILIGSGSISSRFMLSADVWPTGRFVDQLDLVTGAS